VKHEISAKSAGLRVDQVLAETTGKSRRHARALIASGVVCLNGRPILKNGHMLKPGDVLTWESPGSLEQSDPIDSTVSPEIVYEDEALIVALKPRELHSVRQRATDEVTFSDQLLSYLPQQASVSESSNEAGLVSRLDYYSSGLLLAAKSRPVWSKLRRATSAGLIKKSYLVLVQGILDKSEYLFDAPITMPKNRQRVVAKNKPGEDSFSAKTLAHVERRYPKKNCTLVRASLSRGRRHQVRVHFGAAGFPLLGDTLYGGNRAVSEVFPALEINAGFLLHAVSVTLEHPIRSQQLLVEDLKSPFSIQQLRAKLQQQ